MRKGQFLSLLSTNVNRRKNEDSNNDVIERITYIEIIKDRNNYMTV